MEKILQRYEEYSSHQRVVVSDDPKLQESWLFEYGKQKAMIECLMKNQRHLMGEELESLKLKDLQSLELQLEGGLREIRSRKNALLFETISDLQRKEETLRERNKTLGCMLEEKENVIACLAQRAQWPPPFYHHQNQSATSSSASPPSFSPTDTLPATTLNIGIYRPVEEEENQLPPRVNSSLPPWMISHLNGC